MKKKSAIITAAMAGFAFVTALTGCDNSSEPSETPSTVIPEFVSGKEVGRYYFINNGKEYQINLFKKGLVSFNVLGTDVQGTYKLDGTVLTLNLDNGEEIIGEYKNERISFTYSKIKMTFERDVEFVVSFDTLGGSKLYDITVKKGDLIEAPINPTKEHYKFAGWCKDKEGKIAFDFDTTKITEDTKLYAKWIYVEEVNTLSYEISEGMSMTTNEHEVVEGEEFQLEVPTVPNHLLFDGWYLEDGTRLTDNTGKSLEAWKANMGDRKITPKTVLRLNYELNGDNTYAVSGSTYTAGLTEITIPAEYNGIKVTTVNSFTDNSSLVTINIPNTVTSISVSAFDGLKNIAAINITAVEGVEAPTYKSIEGVLFSNDGKKLLRYPVAKEGTEYTVPASVIEIGDGAFRDVIWLGSDYNAATAGTLTKVILPANLMRVSDFAFYQRAKLQTVEFAGTSDLPLVFGNSAFSTTNLQNFVLPKNLVEIGAQCFECNPEYYTTQVKFGEKDTKALVLPDKLEKIGYRAFYYQSSGLSSVTIPASVHTIEAQAFQASGLAKVEFVGESTLTEINEGVFSTYNITEFTIPASVHTIHAKAFENTGITSLVIPATVHTLKYQAFAGMGDLTEITIPETVTSYGGNLFAECESLPLSAVKFAENSKAFSVLDGVVYNADKTEILEFDKTKTDYVMPDTVRHIPGQIFCGVDWQGNTTLKTITLSKSLEEIPQEAFKDCKALTSIVIPASVKSIGASAFEGCLALTSITFAEGSKLETIGDEAFLSGGFKEIVLPLGLKRIGNDAFTFSKVENLVIPDTVTTIGDIAFREMGALKSITLPASLEQLGETPFGGTKTLETISISQDAKNFKVVDNVLYNKDGSVLYYYGTTNKATEYTVLPTTVRIKVGAFAGNTFLTSVTLSESTAILEDSAFSGCKNLATMDIQNVKELGIASLASTALTSVVFNKDLHVIPERCFQNSQLKSLDLSKFEAIGKDAFSNSKNLVYVKFGNKLTELADGSFSFTGITTLVIPGSIKRIGSAFSSLRSLTKVIIEEGVEEIAANAFYQCDAIKEIVLPSTIKSVGNRAFYYARLETIIVKSQAVLDTMKDSELLSKDRRGKYTKKLMVADNLTISESTLKLITDYGLTKHTVDGYTIFE